MRFSLATCSSSKVRSTRCPSAPVCLCSVPRRDAEAAAGFCIAINASSSDGVLTITPAGTPELISKRTLPEPEKQAASLIVTTVNDNRAHAEALITPLLALSHGATPETVLAGTPAAESLPFSGAPRTRASLIQRPPFATENPAAQPTDLEMTELEEAAFGAYLLLQNTLDGSPVCAGPVLIHADGTIECYACSQPTTHLHPGGTSMSCAAGYTFGPGYLCGRCRTAP